MNSFHRRRFICAKHLVTGLVVALLVLAAGAGFVFLRPDGGRDTGRLTMVLVADPVAVWTWNQADADGTVLLFPPDAVIPAVAGYGSYSLEALWKLDAIEGLGGALVTGSLTETLAAPLRWYIGPRSARDTWDHQNDPKTALRRVFSVSGFFSFLKGSWRTNVPIPVFLSLWRRARLGEAKLKTYDFTASSVLASETLPDGSVRRVIDTSRLDALISREFEIGRIREEAESVAILNTTDVPALGSRVARLLSRAGAVVVSVSNDERAVASCELYGTEEALGSETARFITSQYRCKRQVSKESNRVDLTVRIGREYAGFLEAKPQRTK